MAGTKTSVWLGEEQHAQWKASGESLTEIVKRGLATRAPEGTPATAAEVREIVSEEAGALEERLRRIVREELARVTGLQ
jgi:hypothetical protein